MIANILEAVTKWEQVQTLMDILHIYFSRRVGTCSHFVTASNIFAIIPFVFGNNTLTL